MQAWQRGLQQGIKGAQASQQKGSGQLDGGPGLAQTAQGCLVMEQLQGLGVLADGGGNLNSGQLQGLVTMLSKQGESGDVSHLIKFFLSVLLSLLGILVCQVLFKSSSLHSCPMLSGYAVLLGVILPGPLQSTRSQPMLGTY